MNKRWLWLILSVLVHSLPALGQELTLYGAGSLRVAMGEVVDGA